MLDTHPAGILPRTAQIFAYDASESHSRDEYAIADQVRNDGKRERGNSFAEQTETSLPSCLPVIRKCAAFTLAEVLFHPTEQSKRIAFTLAEVLITLGIIGVVAALTMPALIQNHKKHVIETRLKHFYTVINEAVRLSEVYNGDKSTWSIAENGEFLNYIEPYIKYNKIEDIENTMNKRVYLANGSAFSVSFGEIYFFPEAKNIKKTKSLSGRDVFRFAFYPNKTSAIYKFHKNKGAEPYTANWDGTPDTLYTNTSYGCNSKKISATGAFCTAVIQRNGWKIPKDYPFKF